MKRLFLLIIVLFSFSIVDGNCNSPCVSANSIINQNKTVTTTKANHQAKRTNKNTSINITSIIAVGSIIISLLYYGYIIMNLNYLEKRLLSIKNQFYIIVSIIAITILAYILTIFSIVVDAEIRRPIIILLSVYSIALIIITIIAHKQAKSVIVKFKYNGKEFQLLHRIDDTTISAKLLDSSSDNTDDDIYTFSMSDLSNHRIYTKNLKEVSPLNLKPDEYIKNRLDDQINWYDKKSATQKKCYYWSKVVTLICTASIPVISVAFRHQSFTVIVTALIAAIATVTEGILTLTKWHEKWIAYRSNAEALKREEYSYLTSSGAYSELNDDEKFHTLVDRTEDIISNENTNWASLGKKKGKSI